MPSRAARSSPESGAVAPRSHVRIRSAGPGGMRGPYQSAGWRQSWSRDGLTDAPPSPESTRGTMTRWGCALVTVLVAPAAALAKGSCPPGAYVVDRTRVAAVSQMTIDLQRGTVELPGVCPAVAARRYGVALPDQWFVRVVARWSGCAGGVTALRAFQHPQCTAIRGTLRLRAGRRAHFHATRLRACGDGVLQGPEECEPGATACCSTDC